MVIGQIQIREISRNRDLAPENLNRNRERQGHSRSPELRSRNREQPGHNRNPQRRALSRNRSLGQHAQPHAHSQMHLSRSPAHGNPNQPRPARSPIHLSRNPRRRVLSHSRDQHQSRSRIDLRRNPRRPSLNRRPSLQRNSLRLSRPGNQSRRQSLNKRPSRSPSDAGLCQCELRRFPDACLRHLSLKKTESSAKPTPLSDLHQPTTPIKHRL
jgi:hypothetical protein